MNYSNPGTASAVALDAVTPVKLFTTPTPGRKGWRLFNPSATIAVLVACIDQGGTAPTYAQMAAGNMTDYAINPRGTVDDWAQAGVDVYACVLSGTLTVYPKELF